MVQTSVQAASPTISIAKKAIVSFIDFPIKKGSKGEKVKQLQQALIDKYGKAILPKSGADGAFGPEMTAALTKLKLPQEIDETTFNVLIKGKSIDPAALAESLFRGATSKDFNKVNTALKDMKSVNDYQMVNDIFKEKYYFGTSTFPVRKTLVTGLLDSFTVDSQKRDIGLHLSRMGLKYDGSKWSLSGIPQDGISIITTEDCTVHSKNNSAIKTARNTILGKFLAEKHGLTLFENSGQRFYVPSKSVKKI